ncbi:hypothetical protein PV325_011418 [Microctonus aethiopoides]|nr:hypothetical protein PV325_011418 [Microctonus aethiopoides]
MTENASDTIMEVFQNPKNVSLEKVELIIYNDGLPQIFPALSAKWVDKRFFLHYESPNIYHEDGTEIIGAKDRWLEIMDYIADDYNWLLQLPFYKFWSNIVHDPRIMDSIVSVLQESPVFFTYDKFPNDEKMREMLEIVREKVLVIFARIVTNKASQSEFIDHEYHGKLIYDHFLMSVPIMMDLCQLYGRENSRVVERIIKSAIKLQPTYNNDLSEAAQFMCNILTTIDEELFNSTKINVGNAVRLPEQNGVKSEITLENIEDMIIHLLDISSNIEIFLTIYPPAIGYFSNDYFLMKLTTIYGSTIVELYKRLHNLAFNEENMIKYSELKHLLLSTRMELIKIFRIITFKDIAWILEQPTPSEANGAKEHVDRFLNHLANLGTDSEFMMDYNVIYPIDEDLDLLNQITPEVDPVKQNFLLQSISALIKDKSEIKTKKPVLNKVEPTAGPSGLQNVAATAGPSNAVSESPNIKTGDELLNLIQNVKDIMCDLGEGYIEKCLIHYNYDTAAVINAILEGSLPVELSKLDRTLPYIPPDPMAASAAVDAVLGVERLNIYDGDEFDVMTRDKIDTSRVHRGKRKDKYKNLNEMLNDKSFKQDMAGAYVKYGLVEDEYDDEYDDTYESHDVGLHGVDDSLEMDAKLFTTPRVLRMNEKVEETVDDDDDDEEKELNGRQQNDRNNFVQDPAVLRARAEQRRLSKRGGGGGSGTNNRGGHVDVVGRPKGQGNDKNVLINRERKNVNKSTRANHNRRAGSEWKRRQGMVPG